jgi:formylglycine-generating enzyme required for sulfatase activity
MGVLWRSVLLPLPVVLAACRALVGIEDHPVPDETSDAPPQPHPCDPLPGRKVGPDGLSTMVLVKHPNGSCFWIDETEESEGAYQAWLGTLAGGKVQDWSAECSWKNDDPVRAGAPSDAAHDAFNACRMLLEEAPPPKELDPFAGEKPVRCVDWCDAHAFCRGIGKSLCAGPNLEAVVVPTGRPDEWGAACSDGFTRAFPYGNEADPTVCNVDREAQGCLAGAAAGIRCGAVGVGELRDCRYPGGPLDMSGNVREWSLLCSPETDRCQVFGGSYADAVGASSCSARSSQPRREADPATGVRCCLALTPAESVSTRP